MVHVTKNAYDIPTNSMHNKLSGKQAEYETTTMTMTITDFAEEKKSQEEDDFVLIRKKILELGKVKDLRMLDIGAGPLATIAAKYFNCSVTSIDIDKKEMQLWKEYAEKEGVSDRISPEVADASELPYCDDAFDVCICFCALHHFPTGIRGKAVSEFRRISSKRFIIAEYTREGFLDVHSREEFEPVSLDHLEETLKNTGSLKVIPMDKMMVYIVEKNRDCISNRI